MDYGVYIFGGIAIFYILNIIKVTQDQERFACFVLGQFKEFKGPGIFFKLWNHEQWVRLKIGDKGELLSSEVARFHNLDLPIISFSKISIGSVVQITGFENNKINIELSLNQSRFVECPKCGHGFTV